MNIVVVGSLNMDLVVTLPQIPNPGETLLGGKFKTFPGGKGANQAVAAARMGENVTKVGCVGNDFFGNGLLLKLTNDGINTKQIRTHLKYSTGVALIEVDSIGQNSIAVASGANLALAPKGVNIAWSELIKNFALEMPLDIPLETVYTAAKIASDKKAKVFINPAPAQKFPKEILKLVDVLLPNDHEIAVITGLDKFSVTDVKSSWKNILESGVKNVIVTLGGEGAVVTNHKGSEYYIPAYKVEVVDTTAAGDCFIGLFAVVLCVKKDHYEKL